MAEPSLPGHSRPTSVSEVLVACGLLLALAAAVWGSHVFSGGLYWADDWYHARLYLFPEAQGLLANRNPHTSAFRPILGLLMAAPYQVFGLRTELHLALAIVLGVAASGAFYWLLRTMGLERLHAGVVAALPLLFPWSDSTRLWITGSINYIALVFYFCGLVLALHGLRARAGRAWALGAASLALYVLGVLTYEVVGAAALLSVLVYAWWAGWRPALRRWPFDLAGVGAALLYVWQHQPRHHTAYPSLGAQVRHAGRIVIDAVDLLWSAVVPASVPHAAVAVLVVAVLAAAMASWRGLPDADPARAALRRWLLAAGAAVVAIGASYAPFVLGLPKYIPSAPGIFNRINIMAAFGYALLVYALAMLAGTLLARLARQPAVVGTGIAVAACVAIAAGYIARDMEDKRLWALSWQLQRLHLGWIKRLVPAPPQGAVIYAFGGPNYVAPNVPVFALGGDLRNAVKVEFRNPRITAYPMRRRTRWVCGRDRMHPKDSYYAWLEGARYGLGYFVHVRRRRVVLVRDEGECRRWSRDFGHPPTDEPPR